MGRTTPLRAPLVLLLPPALLGAAGCIPTGIPAVPAPPEPFVRYPYVQAVTDSSARVLWATPPREGADDGAPADTLVYWLEGSGDTARLAPPAGAGRNQVRLAPLPPDRRIGYRVIPGAGGRPTPDHVFRTAPRPGAPGEATVLVFGDSGAGTEAQVELARLMEREPFDLVLHTGDVAYPNGSVHDLTTRHFPVYRELLAGTPFFPSAGNHDTRTVGGVPFLLAFVLPGTVSEPPVGGRAAPVPTEETLYYAFQWGRTRFVALSTPGESGRELREGGVQLEWLEEELARASADPKTDWIVVYFHHAPFSSGHGVVGHGSDEALRRALVPLFDRYGVDLVLSGHDHHYERTLPLRGGAVDEETPGTVYVVTGGGGASLEWRNVGRQDFTAEAVRTHHFVTLRVGEEAIELEAVDREGRTIDRARIGRVPAGESGHRGGPGG